MLGFKGKSPMAWMGASLTPDSGLILLPTACLDELKKAVETSVISHVPTSALVPEDYSLTACQALMQKVKIHLDQGIGFSIIDGLPVDEIGVEPCLKMYWLLANLLAPTVAQKWDGTMIYDVRDTGQTMLPGNGVRSSKTRANQKFHTDNSFNLPPDYVGLLCVKTAMDGGLSGLVSFETVHNQLAQDRPDLLERLYQPFWFDRQREHPPEDFNFASAWPVFQIQGSSICTRFSKRLIFGGYEVAGESMDILTREAIQQLVKTLDAPDICHNIEFQPGQIQIINNKRLGHSRTGFTDWPDADRRRHLIRLWLRSKGQRCYLG